MDMYGIKSLANHQQYVSLDGMESSKQKVVCAMPQGSSLGPLLFLIYISDIASCSAKLSFRAELFKARLS